MAPRSTPTRRIVLVVFDGFQSLDAFGPLEVFDHASTAVGRRLYQIELAAPRSGTVTASNGVAVVAPHSLHHLRTQDLDTLVVAGGTGVYDLVEDSASIAEIARLAGGARRIVSVCTGTYALAAAGLLDGRRVTTHWLSCDDLQRRHPELHVDPEPIFVRDGPVATSAGVTAGMDLALDLVEEDHGHALALDVARSLVLFLRRPGTQAQLSGSLAGQLAESRAIRDLQAWVVDHLADDLSVERLADRAGRSPRTFARHFRNEIGTTPARWVETLRLERARRLLEETRAPVEEVGRRCGLAPETLRRLFHRHLGLGPSEYRRRFGSPGPTAARDRGAAAAEPAGAPRDPRQTEKEPSA